MCGAMVQLFGREQERAQLQAVYKRAAAGETVVMLVAGDPGIGKSALLEAAAADAAERGALVVRGPAPEAGPASAYGPWTLVLRALLEHAKEKGTLPSLVTEEHALLALLGEELRPLVPPLTRSLDLDNQAGRDALYAAIYSLLARAAADVPLVLLLDDMHRADTESLSVLLELINRRTSLSVPLLVICAYRDSEVGAGHGLLAVKERVWRDLPPLELGPLPPAVLEEMLAQRVESAGLPELARARAVRLAEGNPFYALLLAAERDGGDAPVTPAAVDILLRQRVNRLSADTRTLLEAGALIGRSFTLPVVRMATGLDEAVCLPALDEAIAAALLERVGRGDALEGDGSERGWSLLPVTYRFRHILYAGALRDHLEDGERRKLHDRIGRAIEALWPLECDAHLEELAYHFAEAALQSSLRRGIDYCRRAGRQAAERYAHAVAVGFLERAVGLIESGTHEDRELCQVLYELVDALRRAAMVEASHSVALRTIALASSVGEDGALMKVASTIRHTRVEQHLPGWREVLERSLHALPPGDSAARAVLLCRLAGDYSLLRSMLWRSDECAGEALAIARRLNDRHLLAVVLSVRATTPWNPDTIGVRTASAQELLRIAAESNDEDFIADAHHINAVLNIELGDRAATLRSQQVSVDLSTKLDQAIDRWNAMRVQGLLLLLEGRFAEAETAIDATSEFGKRFDPAAAFLQWGVQRYMLLRERGELAGLAPFVDAFVQQYPEISAWRCGKAMILCEQTPYDHTDPAHLQHRHQAQVIFEEFARDDFIGIPRDHNWALAMVVLADVCAALDDERRAGKLYALLRSYPGTLLLAGLGYLACGPTSRPLGLLAGQMREWEQAELHFQESLSTCAQWQARPWEAHTKHEWAEMLVRRGRPEDIERAHILASDALAIAEELGMARVAYLCGRMLEQARAQDVPPGRPKPTFPYGLTEREMDVLRLAVEELAPQQIASRLGISKKVVDNRLSEIYRKLTVGSRAAAVSKALREGIIIEPPPTNEE